MKTTRPHTVAYRQLEAYDRRGALFALSRRSYRELVEYAQYPVPLPGIMDMGTRKVDGSLLPPTPSKPRWDDFYPLSGNGAATAASPLLPTSAWQQSARPPVHASATADSDEGDMTVSGPWLSAFTLMAELALAVALSVVLLYAASITCFVILLTRLMPSLFR